MLRIQFATYRRRVAKHSSSAYALLAAIVLDAVLVLSLLHVAFRFQHGSDSPKALTIEPGRRVTYVTLSPTNQIPATTDAKIQAPGGASAKSTLSRSPEPTVVEPQTAPIDTVVASLESSRQRSHRAFQAVMPHIVERTREEVIDSIIKTSIQPGNDSATRMRLARRNAVDWTVRVRGESYGMSPGEVHLGKISIRFPLVFAEPLSLDSDRRRLARGAAGDTRINAARAARDAAFDSAVASIRLRKGAERLSGTNSILDSHRNHHR
jgi:hypothetical protein